MYMLEKGSYRKVSHCIISFYTFVRYIGTVILQIQKLQNYHTIITFYDQYVSVICVKNQGMFEYG